ncbi:MAG TPA: sigma-E processing peptidase SpoIIGA [Oscillospiraceae bacterium]|nr:sigma-E processing peptidase SpoIIGA [Oscillospiraceae bacterium]
MVTVVYLDSLFLVNTVMDYALLRAAAALSGEPLRRLRLLSGALFGGLYAALRYVPSFAFLRAGPMVLAAGVAMVLLAFSGTRRFLRQVLLFFGVACAFAGGVLAAAIFSGNPLTLPVGMEPLLLGGAICYGLFLLVFRCAAKYGGDGEKLVDVKLACFGHRVELRALVDTGNTLTDPMTNRPVLVAEGEALRDLLPRRLRTLLTPERLRDPVAAMGLASEAGLGARFRLLPYRAVGTDGGLLLALRVDEAEIGRRREKNVLVALSPHPLSDGAWTALAPDGQLL